MLIEKDCVVGIHVRMFDLQKNLLEEKKCFKLICGAGNENEIEVEE